MKARCILLLWCLTAPLCAVVAVPTSQVTPDSLVGEDGAAPTALPTPQGDAGGPAVVSRAAQTAPSFALPAFVVMGGGERQDLVQRGDLGGALDTSGGIKTSPGEKGAGQDQRETEAVRVAPDDETYTPVPRYGELAASYGLGNTLNVDGLLAGEHGPFYGWLDGGTHFDDGGPLPSSALEPAQRHDARLASEGGWRLDPDDLVEAAVDGAWRSLRLTAVPGDTWLQREQAGLSATWEGDGPGLTQRVQVRGREAQIDLPGYGYAQSGGGAGYSAEKSLRGLLVDLGVDLDGLDQRDTQAARSVFVGSLWFEGHMQPWSGARLGLGLKADGVSGGVKAFELGPRLHFEQSLTRDLGLRLEFGTGITLSRLDGGEFTEDPLLPNLQARPSREVADFKASLPWRPLPGLSLEGGAFVREDEDAFLPGQAPQPGLWTDTTVGTLQVGGGSLDERLEHGPWWQDFQGLGQKAALATGGLVPTFIPNWKASATVGFKQGAWSAETGLKAVGPRQASLVGAWVVPTQFDWHMHIGFDLNESLTLFMEGDSLAGAVVDWPLYTDPAPYLGLGAKLRF